MTESTESKRIQELLARIDDLEKTSVAKSEFLANMSHELRSPMTSIIAMTHMLQETELNPEQRECADVISTSANGLLSLINDTLDISKLDAGKVELESISFNLYGLIEQICRAFSIQAHKKGIALVIDVDPRSHQQYKGDPGRIRQILTNLVSNAIKFTSKGAVAVSMEEAETFVFISVTDSGIGIPPAAQEKIFNKFEQADQSTTRRYGGTGLGLAICKELSELMGGGISLASKKDKGSCFKVHLPLIKEDEEKKELHRADIEGRRLLVVDSNPATLTIMKRNFERSGLHCETASKASEAFRVISKAHKQKKAIELVITDFQLPDVDGVKMAQKLKTALGPKSPQFFMLTSMGRKGDSQLVSDAGFEAYLVKPTAHELLLEALSCVYGNRHKENKELITKYTIAEDKASREQTQGPRNLSQETQLSDQASQAPAEDIDLTQLRVVIAEDDPMIQKVLHKLMKKLKLNYTLIDDGKKAIAAFKHEKPALILMDWHMPECDGLTAASEIRKIEGQHRSTWIVGLTAGGTDNVKEKCLAAGMDDHLAKPFDVDIFKKTVFHGLEMGRQLQQVSVNPS